MEKLTFFERYRVSVTDNGQAREIGRSGAAVTYRAVDLQSGEPIALKVLPMRAIDPELREQFEDRVRAAQHVEHVNIVKLLAFIVDTDDYVLVSEYPQGETVASWVGTHGPLAPDAALRVGLQVVSALNAAAFHNLTHAAIEPSNIFIVPGQTANGAWPAIKLANIDTSGVQLLPLEQDAPAVGAPIAPQFASPEQLQNKPVDFRSEIYSLGTTICFMLTGLAPLGSASAKPGESARLPATLRRAPRAVRELLGDMLRINPDERPQDPVAFAERIAECLAKVERRGAAARKLGVPVSPVIAAPAPRRRISFPARQLAIAAAVVLLGLLAVVAAQPLRKAWSSRHRDVTQIGVPVGVPDASPVNRPQNAAPPAATNIAQNAPPPTRSEPPPAQQTTAPEPAAQSETPPQVVSVDQQSPPPATAAPVEETNARVAANEQTSEPAAPAEQPPAAANEPTSTQEASTRPEVSNDHPATAQGQTTTDGSAARETSHVAAARPEASRKKVTKAKRSESRTPSSESESINETESRDRYAERPIPRGEQRARYVGTTRDGQWIFEAPSGEAVAELPPDDQPRRRPSRHRQRRPAAEEDNEPTVLRALPADDD